MAARSPLDPLHGVLPVDAQIKKLPKHELVQWIYSLGEQVASMKKAQREAILEKVKIPVKCHNGHTAFATYRIDGLEMVYEGVGAGENCPCSKFQAGEGWQATGPAVPVLRKS